MPSTRPCAAFEPISPNFDIKALVESSPNFEWVVRIHCDMIDQQGIEAFERLVLIHVIIGGKPLVIEGYHERLDRWTFALQWLKDNVASKVEMARDLTKKTNVPLSIGHYLNHMALLTNQWTDKNYKDAQRQRMYLKDIDCPQLWNDKVRDIIPLGLFYLSESTGDIGGLGAVDESDPNGPGIRKGRGVARAGDLMSSLPKEMRAENMMCYIGHEGTYTPAHQEMCASLGQNIMVECSTGAVEDGKQTKPGSSIWFMTESKERHVVSEYWLSKLGHDIEIENHFAQINAWKAAPFKTYVVEQRTGDFILIPPLAPHQVWNRGTRTMKVAWNRTSVETLEMALHDALPRARMVCRDEQYKNKAIVYYSLQKYSKLLRTADKARQKKPSKRLSDAQVRQVEKDFRRLQALFTEILVSESFLTHQNEKKIDLVPFDSNITCSYCRCNIFNRFLTCPSCVSDLPDGEQDTYDICMECYAMGRSCACISKLKWVEQFPWAELIQNHENWRYQILQTESNVTEKSPKSLKTELERLGRKRTLAQICQLELIRRPFRDISKPPPVEGVDRSNEDETDANGNIKKRKFRRSGKFMKEHARCHVDMHWEPKWKQARCSHCEKNYCYGVLFRAYDMLPQDILTDPSWKCPSCLKICGCRSCKTKPGYTPFTPSGTILGHNTKAVADPRSVESLVDFSFSNIQWIQKAGDDHEDDTRRLQKRQRAAAAAKSRAAELGDNYVEDTISEPNEVEDNLLRLAEQEGIIPIDPALASIATPNGGSLDDEDYFEENPEEARRNAAYSQNNLLVPQFVVPVGGVIRDFDHAYDMTEAITYDYPDPDAGAPIFPLADKTEQGLSGDYELVAPNSPGRIEMVNRKRKREKIDHLDRLYGGHKAKKPATEQCRPKHRKSLIVSLNINGEKLSSVNNMAAIAQKALNGIADAPAPVVGSDLRALNAEWNRADGHGQAFTKRPRVEQLDMDVDDDFTPSRRRKTVTDDSVRPPQDGEISRRTTRMQAITYEKPSDEEEINETVAERPSRSKLATMEGLGLDTGSEPAPRRVTASASTTNLDGIADTETDAEADQAVYTDDLFGDTLDSVLSLPGSAPRLGVKSSQVRIRVKGKAAVISNGNHQSNTAAKTVQSPKISLAEIRANRKAKMAAFEWAERDSESLEEWSEDERRPSPPNRAAALPPAKSMKDRKSMPNLQRPTSQAAREPAKATSVQKASVADWGDDSSDDDGSSIHAAPAWSSVNKPRSSGLKPITAPRGRSRRPSGSKLA